MTLDVWISTHSYLRPIGDFCSRLTEALNHDPIAPIAITHIPNWANYKEKYEQGLPLLRSSHVTVDYDEVARTVSSLLEQLSAIPPSGTIRKECQDLSSYFRGNYAELRRAVEVLLADDEPAPLHPGLLRHIAWSAMVRYLDPLLSAFQNWRDEESWSCPYCPVCGSGPSMAQLVSADSGRRRLLICGFCGMRWSFPRMRCPFCDNINDHKLFVLTIEGEKHLRIDGCDACSGYLKTYDGEGAEGVLLADWTSLHLDLLAQDRELRRLATSLYQL